MGFQLLKAIAEFICLFVCFACLCFLFRAMISQSSVQNQTNLTWLSTDTAVDNALGELVLTSIGQFYLKRGK